MRLHGQSRNPALHIQDSELETDSEIYLCAPVSSHCGRRRHILADGIPMRASECALGPHRQRKVHIEGGLR